MEEALSSRGLMPPHLRLLFKVSVPPFRTSSFAWVLRELAVQQLSGNRVDSYSDDRISPSHRVLSNTDSMLVEQALSSTS